MNVSIGGKPITTDKLRTLGFSLIDLATAVDRHAIQLGQSQAKPDDDKEREQADMAASRCIGAMRRARRLIAEATA